MLVKSYRLSDRNLWNKINEDFLDRGGIYRLYCIDQEQQVVVTHRLIKADPTGTLYIGKATSFLDRVINLKKSIAPEYKSSGHACGVRYKGLDCISTTFPYDNLMIELRRCEDPASYEKELLKQYEWKFGELPPLNRYR